MAQTNEELFEFLYQSVLEEYGIQRNVSYEEFHKNAKWFQRNTFYLSVLWFNDIK